MIFKNLFKKKKKEPAKQDLIEEKEVGELAIDAYETQNEIVIQSPIGGITANDLEISLEDGILVIKGKRERPKTDDKIKRFFYQECFWGAFERKLILPKEVEIAKAKATIKNGILILRIPKIEEKEQREIKLEIKEEE